MEAPNQRESLPSGTAAVDRVGGRPVISVGMIMAGTFFATMALVTVAVFTGPPPNDVAPREFLDHVERGNFAGEISIEGTRFHGKPKPEVIQRAVHGRREGVSTEVSEATRAAWLDRYKKAAGGSVVFREVAPGSAWKYLLVEWGPYVLLSLMIYFGMQWHLRRQAALQLKTVGGLGVSSGPGEEGARSNGSESR